MTERNRSLDRNDTQRKLNKQALEWAAARVADSDLNVVFGDFDASDKEKCERLNYAQRYAAHRIRNLITDGR